MQCRPTRSWLVRVTEAEDEPLGFDIGVGGARSGSTAGHAVSARPKRRPPRWAIAALGMMAGLLIGAVLGSSQGEPRTVQPTPAATSESTQPTLAPPTLAPPTSLPSPPPIVAPRSLAGQTIVVADLSGADRLPSSITLINEAGGRNVLVEGRIAGPTQAAVGHVDWRVVVVDQQLVFVADRSAMLLDLTQPAPPVRLTDAVRLMPAADAGLVWVLGSNTDKITLVDVRARSVSQVYDMTEVGEPVASYQGGLVVATVNDDLDGFALWSPARGIEEIVGLPVGSGFIDAGGSVVVIHTAQGVAAYSSILGTLRQTDRQLTTREQSRAFVSPDGSLLAIVKRASVIDRPTVEILDLATGETVDEFPAASEWLLHWVSNDQMLYISPSNDSKVQLRHVLRAETSELTDLDGPATWVTLAG